MEEKIQIIKELLIQRRNLEAHKILNELDEEISELKNQIKNLEEKLKKFEEEK